MSSPAEIRVRVASGIVNAFGTYRAADFSGVDNPLQCVVPVKYPEPAKLMILALKGSKKHTILRVIEENPYTSGHVAIILFVGMLKKTYEILVRAYPGVRFFTSAEFLVYADGWPRVVPSIIYVMRDQHQIDAAMRESGMTLKDVTTLPFLRHGDVVTRFLGASVGDVVAFVENTHLLFDKVRQMRVVVQDGFIGGEDAVEVAGAEELDECDG